MTRRFKLLLMLLCILCTVALCSIPAFAEETLYTPDTPTEPVAVSFTVMRGVNSKTAYLEGESFNPTDFVGKVTYDDGSYKFKFFGDFTYRETAPLTADITYITFDYLEFSYKYPITVIPMSIEPEKNVVGIDFSATKTDFLALEIIDPAIFSAQVIYSDGTTEPLDLSLCTVFPSISDPVSAYTTLYTLTYNDGSTTFSDSINVSVSPIILLEVSGLENAKLYEAMPYSPPTGLTVTAYYDGMKTISQVITNYTVTSDTLIVTPDDQGKTKITITADSVVYESEIDVLPIVNYEISGLKSAYYYGDTVSLADVKVTAYYSDLTSYDVTDHVVFTAPDTVVAGSSMSAIHNGFDLKDFLAAKTSFPEGTLSIITEPSKLHYEIGETFDSTGLQLGINYSDGTRRLLRVGDCELIVSSPLTTADKLVTVKYYGASASISISVGDEAYIVSIQLIGVPDVMTYYEGNLISTAGVIIEAYMSDGSKLIVDPRILTFSPSLDTPLTTDITEVKISANDGTDKYCECSFPIRVIEKIPTGLMATSKPAKLEYAEGEIFNPDGLTLSLFFNDGTSIVPSSFTFSPELGSTIILHSNATEKCIIYAVYEYEGVEYTYPIEITVTPAEIESILISRQPIKTVYEVGEEFIPMGIELFLFYKDRSLTPQAVPEGYYTYSPQIITEDTTEIVFSFRGYNVSLPITVNGGVTTPEATTQPPEPPITTEPPIVDPPVSSDVTTDSGEITTDNTTEGSDVTTDSEPTTGPEVTPDTPEVTSSPDNSTTTEGENTTGENQGGKDKNPSSLLYLWIIIIVIIIAALVALIIYYKKNFT